MAKSARVLVPALWASFLVARVAAAPYTVMLSGQAELGAVRGDSAAVVRALKATQRAAFAAVADELAALGLAEAGIEHLWACNAVAVDVTPEAAARIAALPGVDAVLASRVIPPLPVVRRAVAAAPAAGPTWSLVKMRVPEVWSQLGLDGTGVVVGHIDTGVDPNHPDLKGKIKAFRDFVDSNNATPKDGDGHGTHTAGTIVGGAANGTAIGVAPKAKLVVARVLGPNGSHSIRLIRAMQWMLDPDGNDATADAPHLVSNSWGSTLAHDPSFWLTIRSWKAAGMVPVFAAGNEGPGAKTMGAPGAYPHSFAVGATDDRDAIADFSSRGPVRWGLTNYLKPDVSAPGDGVYSAADGGGYVFMSGTSMATPNVAGVVALLKQKWKAASPDQLEDLLERTARDKGPAGKDNDFGSGIVDALAAAKGSLLTREDVRRALYQTHQGR